MPLQSPPTVLLYLANAVAALFLCVLVWRKREEKGADALLVILVGIAVASVGQGMSDAFVTVDVKLQWVSIGMLGSALVPVGWLSFALIYTGYGHWINRRSLALLSVEPLVVFTVSLIPQFRSLLFTVERVDRSGAVTIDMGVGPILAFHFAYYFVVLIVGSVLFVQLFVRSRHLYRTQAGALLFAAVFPFAGHALSLTNVLPEGLDLTPFLLNASAAAMVVAIYEFRLLDPVPVAHETVIEEMGDGVVVVDDEDCIGHVNPAACSLLGIDDESVVLGEHVRTVFAPWDDLTSGEEGPDGGGDDGGDEVLAGGDGGSGTGELSAGDWVEREFDLDGQRRYVEAQVVPFSDHLGELVGRFLVLRDVTDRKEREQTLARYKTVFETVRDRVYVLDGDDRFIMVNEPFADMLQCDPEDLIGEPFESILAGSDTPEAFAESSAADGGLVEVTVETAGGEVVPCETRRAPIEFENITGSVGYVRDISKRRRTERDLRETAGALETLVDASPLAVLASDEEGRVETWNPAAEEIFGYTAAEVEGEVPPIVPESERETVRERLRRVLDGERFTGIETQLEHRDGTLIDCSVSVAPLHDAAGEIRGTVSVVADITDRKERERELQRKNERLEQFAGIVSHDLRNPLQVASSNLAYVQQTGDTDRIANAQDALGRMEEIIDDVLRLARRGQDISEREPVDLASVAAQARATVDLAGATLEVTDLPEVEGDRTRLLELFENLLRNSVEHGGQDVHIRAGSLPDGDGFYVEDDGPGIPPGDRESVFEPGFTTAEDGTGFGLAIVRTIADAHGWTVTVTDASHGLTHEGSGVDGDDQHGARFEFRV